jgi:cellulose synthase (UDP-forming)
MEGSLQRRADVTAFTRAGQLKAALLSVLAAVLLLLPIVGLLFRGQESIDAITWGWEDILAPMTSELKHGRKVNYGVYDFDARKPFSQARGVAIEHIFVSWLSSDSSASINSSFQYANERNRWLMVTIEPFAVEGRNRHQLLDDVVAGKYDSIIASVCGSIGSLQSSMFVRWGHEMETGDLRYPWSGTDGDRYIAAYRHFAERCRAAAPKIFLVWSPKGESKLAKYYPGRPYVDFVGLSLYELPAHDLDRFGKVMKFQDAFTPKYNRVTAFDRPVMIAEMGVSGPPKYQTSWMADFFRSVQLFPLLRTAVYFNGKDSPGAWPEKYGVPDWTIDPNIFE